MIDDRVLTISDAFSQQQSRQHSVLSASASQLAGSLLCNYANTTNTKSILVTLCYVVLT